MDTSKRKFLRGALAGAVFAALPVPLQAATTKLTAQAFEDEIVSHLTLKAFELNDEKTRGRLIESIKQTIEKFSKDLDIEESLVICDDSNNDTKIVDLNIMNVDVYLKSSNGKMMMKQFTFTSSAISMQEIREFIVLEN